MYFKILNVGIIVFLQHVSQLKRGKISEEQKQEEQIASRRKAARMLMAIVIAFAVCFLPVHEYSKVCQ